MIDKKGISGIGKAINPTNSSLNKTSNSFFIGRVKDIILDINHPLFQELGNYQSIGTVIYEPLDKYNLPTSTLYAKPFYPGFKSYPLVDEIVLLINAPVSLQNDNSFTDITYYISNINLWNSPHINALPNPTTPSSNSGDAQLNSPSNPTQQTFLEKENINPLLPFSGDIIYEGRFGQSLRFGNTAKNVFNPWSSVGDNGDPIIILRNGQSPEIKENGWVNITEDINNDLSTIYLTSTQKINFSSDIVNRFNKFNLLGRALDLNNYILPQIILNTDRVIINAKKDSILIGSNKGINLSTNEFLNVNSKNLYVDAKNILLGDNKANESLILGDSFMRDFNLLLTSLNTLCSVLEFDLSWPGGSPAPNTPVNTAASALKTQIEDIKIKISTSKFISKTSKTI